MSEEMEWGYVFECRLIRAGEMERKKKRKNARFKYQVFLLS